MLRKKSIIVLFISSLFILILFSPNICAEGNINKNKILTIWMPGITENNFFTQINISEEQFKDFNPFQLRKAIEIKLNNIYKICQQIAA